MARYKYIDTCPRFLAVDLILSCCWAGWAADVGINEQCKLRRMLGVL